MTRWQNSKVASGWWRCIAASVAALMVSPASAVTLDGAAELLSDYRFRGVSLSDRQPVVDASLEAAQGSWFAGVEAISASRFRSPDRIARQDAESDVSGGWSRAIGLLTPAVGAIAYVHPGGQAALGEGFASLAGAIGPATLTIGANYAPAQAAAHGGNLYTFVRATSGIPSTPLTLRLAAGREAGALAGGRVKLDWSGGVEVQVAKVVTLGLAYVGNDLPRVGPFARNRANGVVVRAGVRF